MKMLVRPLHRRDDEIVRCDKPRLSHHVTLVSAVTVNGDQQRHRPLSWSLRHEKVVVEFYLGGERQVRLQVFAVHKLSGRPLLAGRELVQYSHLCRVFSNASTRSPRSKTKIVSPFGSTGRSSFSSS